ncbi:hypothetical protein PRZ48_005301 [Zasmidium cellare]|uniref:Uncharacterized protein n=1 Tax=Zasmidium cellare TaxID=395010 RepID=A0ABR0ET07_ZASCE|nr:hypothetical protein PRZ48_005301 [Zasmidium cellare]
MDSAITDAINEILELLIDHKQSVIGDMGRVQTYMQLEVVMADVIHNTAAGPLLEALISVHEHVDDNSDAGELRGLLMLHVNEAPRLTIEQQVRLREILAGIILAGWETAVSKNDVDNVYRKSEKEARDDENACRGENNVGNVYRKTREIREREEARGGENENDKGNDANRSSE